MDPKVERVVTAGKERGIDVEPKTFPSDTRTAAQAAEAVGCDVAAIVKSLIFDSEDGPALFLVSGANRLDLEKAEAASGHKKLTQASAARAKEVTGFSIGATPPFGSTTEVPVFVDQDLISHAVVWAAAGRPDSVFPVSPHDLVRAAGASIADLRADRASGP